MRRLWMSLLAGLLLTSLAPAADNDKIFPYPIHKETLDNGLQVVTVPFDSPGIVSFFVVVRVGSREEVEDGVTGFAHFFEHCMFRGTEKYPTEKYNQALLEMAAASNANTSLDRTLYHITGNVDKLELLFEVESDRFQHLKYSEHGFKTEAGAVLGEYTKNFASPFRRLYEKVQATAFKSHTYGHTTMGYIDDIKDMPNQYEYSLKFYDRFYRPEYCTVMVVGDVTHDRVMNLSKQYFGSWEKGSYQPEIPVEPEQTAPRRDHVNYDGDTNMLGIYYKTPAFGDTDKEKTAMDLLMALKFSNRSPIYKKLVNEEQKIQNLWPDPTDTRDPYLTGILVRVFNKEDMPYVEEQLLAAMEETKTTPVDAKELAELKSRLKYQMSAQLNTPLSVGNNLASYIWLTGDPESLNRSYATMETVTVEDLQNAAKKFIDAKKRVIVTLGKGAGQ